jgi:hypothetical protein
MVDFTSDDNGALLTRGQLAGHALACIGLWALIYLALLVTP